MGPKLIKNCRDLYSVRSLLFITVITVSPCVSATDQTCPDRSATWISRISLVIFSEIHKSCESSYTRMDNQYLSNREPDDSYRHGISNEAQKPSKLLNNPQSHRASSGYITTAPQVESTKRDVLKNRTVDGFSTLGGN
jgi:hypothetical protein